MKTDYAGHDRAYLRKRAAGEVGWASDVDYAEHFAALAKLPLPRSGDVLELGCGAGNVTAWLARRGYAVHGVDISPAAIAWARERFAAEGLRGELQVGDVLELAAYPDAAFDLVIDGHCLHCIIGADRALVLASARRVMREGAALCIRTMCGDPVSELLEAYDPVSRCLVRDGVASRYLGQRDTITTEIVAAGFAIVHAELEPGTNGDQPMLLLLARR